MTARKAQGMDAVIPWPDSQGPWMLTLNLRLDRDGFRCVGLSLQPAAASSPPTVTSTVLRDIPIAALTRERAKLITDIDRARIVGGPAGQELRRLSKGFSGRADPRTRTEHFYEEVASVYQRARAAGKLPTQAVAKHWDAPSPRAATWVRRARERGLIPAAPKQGSWR